MTKALKAEPKVATRVAMAVLAMTITPKAEPAVASGSKVATRINRVAFRHPDKKFRRYWLLVIVIS